MNYNGMLPNVNVQTNSNQRLQKEGFFKSRSKKDKLIIFLIAVVVLQFSFIVLSAKPEFIFGNENKEVLGAVAGLTTVNNSEEPAIAQIADADALRAENPLHAEVYKNAQDGDYLLGYSDKMVIYRKSDNTIVYEGKSPRMILEETESTLANEIIQYAKSNGYLEQGSSESPQMNIVTDPDSLIQSAPKFYEGLKINDVVASFSNSKVLIIYRPESKEFINAGKFDIQIYN